jgi:hypothetical protein
MGHGLAAVHGAGRGAQVAAHSDALAEEHQVAVLHKASYEGRDAAVAGRHNERS